MQRRKFLSIISLGVAGSAVGFASLPSFEKMIEKMILNDTAQLKIEKGTIESYLKDIREKNIYRQFNFSKKEFIRAHYLLSNSLFTLPYYAKYIQYRSEIVGSFLLSTNFFENKMDTNKTISYRSFYDPYFRPCAHPFSNLFYS